MPIPGADRMPPRDLIAGDIQFGWALQLSLLTPYVQELGIPHKWASIIWLCGPLSGLIGPDERSLHQPFRPAQAVHLALLIISHSADIGCLSGDRGGQVKPRAIAVFVFGFWILDVANNMSEGSCRALLADLTEKDHRRTRVAKCLFLTIHGHWQYSWLCYWIIQWLVQNFPLYCYLCM